MKIKRIIGMCLAMIIFLGAISTTVAMIAFALQ